MKRWHLLVMLGVAVLLSFAVHPAFAAVSVTHAMATTITTDIDEALKLLTQDPLIENIVTDSELLDLFEQDSNVKIDETTGGRYIETAQQFRLNSGYGYRSEADYIPVPGAGLVKNSRIDLKKSIGTVEMSGDVMRKLKGNPGAYVDWAERELPNLVRRQTNEDDRIMIGFGAGAKARVDTDYNATSTTVPVDRMHGVTGLGNDFAWLNFLEGETLRASPNLDGTSPRTGVMTVTVVNQDANTLLVDAAATSLADNDYLFPADSAGASWQDSGTDREFMGLLGMVDGGSILSTFQGILRADFTQWQSVVIDASSAFSGVLSEDCLTYADDQCDVKGGGKVNVIVASKSGQRSFWKSLKTDRVINTNTGTPGSYQGGKKGLSMLLGDRVLEVRAARKMPPEIAFGLSTDTFRRHMLGRWEWDDTTGSIWKQVTDSTGRKDAFFAYGHKYLQMSCNAPRRNFKITGLTAVT